MIRIATVARALLFLSCAALVSGSAAPGRSAPALHAATSNGTQIDLNAYRGRVVIVDFCASWCEPCRQSIPALDDLARRYGDRGVVVIGVSVDEDRGHFDAFAREMHPRFALIYDRGQAIAAAWAPESMPDTFVVDPSGTIAAEYRGFTPAEGARLERDVAAMLARTR